MGKKIKVHVADDHKILIEGIIAVINTEEDIFVEGYSLTGKEGLTISGNKDHTSKKASNIIFSDMIKILK